MVLIAAPEVYNIASARIPLSMALVLVSGAVMVAMIQNHRVVRGLVVTVFMTACLTYVFTFGKQSPTQFWGIFIFYGIIYGAFFAAHVGFAFFYAWLIRRAWGKQ
jgi:hypothetical protein